MKNIFQKIFQRPEQTPVVDPKHAELLKPAFKYEGHTFYVPNGDIIEESFMRRYAKYLRIIKAASGFKLDDYKVTKMFDDIEQRLRGDDFVGASQIIMFMRTLHESTVIDEQFMEIADCFIWIDDEPLRDFSYEHSQLKKKLYKDVEDVRFFLRQRAYEYMKRIIDTSDDFNYEEYLNNPTNQVINTMSQKLVSQISYPEYGKTSMPK